MWALTVSALPMRRTLLWKVLLLWAVMMIPIVQSSSDSNTIHQQEEPVEKMQPNVRQRRKALIDDTLGNQEDDEQYKGPGQEQSQPQHYTHPEHGTAAHHTFASARHDHQNLHYDKPQQHASAHDVMSHGMPGVASTNSDKNVMVTPWNHVKIQDAVLPYGAQGRPHCDGQQLIVTCQPDTEVACYYALDEVGVEIVKTIKGTDLFVICIPTNDVSNLEDQVEALDIVVSIEPDPLRDLAYIRGSKRSLLFQHRGPNSHKTPQEMGFGLPLSQIPQFWKEYGAQGEGVTVCVVDTGLRATHEDINTANAKGSDDVDLVNPWDEDGYGHGSHVTGIVAAMDNTIGVVGAAPNANIYVARVFDDEGTFRASSLIEAMKECYDEGGAQIINLSIGGGLASKSERLKTEDLANKGVLIVAAAGNFGDDIGQNILSFPGGYDQVLSVGAVDEKERVADFSCFNDKVGLTAAGFNVLSTGGDKDNEYTYLSGTSQASPYVAGVATLLMSAFPDKTADEVWKAMTATAKDKGACGPDPLFGAGIVQALDAGKYLEGTNSQPQDTTSSCIATKITVQMPESAAGNATRFDIRSHSDKTVIIFRGGTLDEGDFFQTDIGLVDDCYDFVVWDIYGQGFEEGSGGYIELMYNGEQIVYSESLSGDKDWTTFGNCGSNTATASEVASIESEEQPASVGSTPSAGKAAPASHHAKNRNTGGAS